MLSLNKIDSYAIFKLFVYMIRETFYTEQCIESSSK